MKVRSKNTLTTVTKVMFHFLWGAADSPPQRLPIDATGN